MGKTADNITSKLVSKKKLPAVEYGLDGIKRIFHCSKSTAFRYRHGILQEACVQYGNKIIIDVRKALRLFGATTEDVEALVEDDESGTTPETNG